MDFWKSTNSPQTRPVILKDINFLINFNPKGTISENVNTQILFYYFHHPYFKP